MSKIATKAITVHAFFKMRCKRKDSTAGKTIVRELINAYESNHGEVTYLWIFEIAFEIFRKDPSGPVQSALPNE
jgi:hypothetical protein